MYDPTLRPRLSAEFWIVGHGPPGPRYYVTVDAQLSICNRGEVGPVALLVWERKWIGKRTFARANWRRGVGTVEGCELRGFSWRLAERFFGVGNYTATIRARNSAGLLSNTVKKTWFTGD